MRGFWVVLWYLVSVGRRIGNVLNLKEKDGWWNGGLRSRYCTPQSRGGAGAVQNAANAKDIGMAL